MEHLPYTTVRQNNSTFRGTNLTIYGDYNTIKADKSFLYGGDDIVVEGSNNRVSGCGLTVQGDSNVIQGNGNDATDTSRRARSPFMDSYSDRETTFVAGDGNTVTGIAVYVTGSNNTITGEYVSANGGDNNTINGLTAEQNDQVHSERFEQMARAQLQAFQSFSQRFADSQPRSLSRGSLHNGRRLFGLSTRTSARNTQTPGQKRFPV